MCITRDTRPFKTSLTLACKYNSSLVGGPYNDATVLPGSVDESQIE
jgi:hypothetical protein